MTDLTKTSIAVILDRSGSMGSCVNDTIGGFNTFLQKQKEQLDGAITATMSLIQFDNQYEPNYLDMRLRDVPLLTHETYQPRGGTALHDAIGRTITELGAKFARLPEHERPGKVVVLIITDGEENASREYDRERIRTMIEHQRSVYAWQFLFVGANQDGVLTGNSLGIAKGMSASYTPNHTRSLFANLASNAAAYMNTPVGAGQAVMDAALEFTDEQRAKMTTP